MARKQETIPEQVVRLYKEGQSLDSIASIMQMNKGGARAILEKHMPDFESYQQPAVPQATDVQPEKKGKGKIGSPVNLFKKKKKEEHAVNPGDVSINLAVDEFGFVDKHTESIAKMIRRGDSDKKIAEFFNCSVNDVRAVKAVLDQQSFKPQESAAPANAAPAEEEFNPFLADKKKRDTNLTKMAEEKAAERQQEYGGYDPYGPNAVADPYAVPYDGNTAASEPVAEPEPEPAPAPAPEPEYQMEEIEYIPDIKFEDDGLAEMPSISTDNLVFDEPPAVPTSDTIDSIATDDIQFDMDSIDSVEIPSASGTEEQISFELKESDAEMTASEKMKMFAKQQIEENNTKLDSLNNEKDRAARELADAEADLAATKKNIDDCEAEISKLNIQLSEINAKLTDLQSRLSEYQINENKLLDNTVRSRAASQDLENSIAEILKENAEYEAFLN